MGFYRFTPTLGFYHFTPKLTKLSAFTVLSEKRPTFTIPPPYDRKPNFRARDTSADGGAPSAVTRVGIRSRHERGVRSEDKRYRKCTMHKRESYTRERERERREREREAAHTLLPPHSRRTRDSADISARALTAHFPVFWHVWFLRASVYALRALLGGQQRLEPE